MKYAREGDTMSYPQDEYRAIFDFHRRYLPYPRTLEDWENVTNDLISISARFNSPFVREMLCAVYGEFERCYKAHSLEGT